MADDRIPVSPDSTGLGPSVDTSSIERDGVTIHRQRVNVADPTDEAAVAAVLNSVPAQTDYGQVVRGVPSDFILEVQKGNVAGHLFWCAMGERESMGTTASGEDLWRGNELSNTPAALTSTTTIPTPAAAGEQMTIISESADDDVGGDGIEEVSVEYLDPAGDEQTTTVIMNGQTGVNLTPSDVRFVQSLSASDISAFGDVAAGHIRIYNTGTPALVYNMIAAGGNMSLVPHRMVPRAKTLYLQSWNGTEAQNKRCAIRMRSTDFGGVLRPGIFLFKSVAYLRASSSGDLPLRNVAPALSIVKASGWVAVSGAEASVYWCGILVDD